MTSREKAWQNFSFRAEVLPGEAEVDVLGLVDAEARRELAGSSGIPR
jgi:hypothetical protein